VEKRSARAWCVRMDDINRELGGVSKGELGVREEGMTDSAWYR
jgi:hypothetical protein